MTGPPVPKRALPALIGSQRAVSLAGRASGG